MHLFQEKVAVRGCWVDSFSKAGSSIERINLRIRISRFTFVKESFGVMTQQSLFSSSVGSAACSRVALAARTDGRISQLSGGTKIPPLFLKKESSSSDCDEVVFVIFQMFAQETVKTAESSCS